MQPIKERRIEKDGIIFHFIQSKKYKTVNLVAKLRSPLHKDTLTKRALLPYILKQGTKSFPTTEALQLKLDELYGAVFSIQGGKKGENHIITFRMELANAKYIPEATPVLGEGISLFSEFLFQPNVQNDAFDTMVFEREVDTLKQKMNAIKDDKMKYANQRLIDEMCKDEPYGLHVQGYEEDLANISSKDLYSYYLSIIQEDQLDVYVLGDFDEEDMLSKLSNELKRENSHVYQNEVQTFNVTEPKEVIEKQNLQQAKLHIGYRTNVFFKDDDYPALQVFNGMYGGFPSSKLFINVREKNSLAYYASSRMESLKGLLFVFSGIAPEDFEKARDIIREQLTAMKEGDFSEEMLAETKEQIVNQLLETMDHPQGLIELLYQQVIGDKELTPDQLIENIKLVNKEDVIGVANKVQEDTVYLLTSKGGQANE
ncbi:insulinase family protein [Oceanobacillus piezotolerans]|uniref:Insulinase family protein n=1 Tax=Oceanobacillus piezotolerans TaxID=2448030 RepID=A0A498D7F0_9BACI|nr:pitrilysin family protein [Oceanobacillus piezotolerans]RLL45376.1 insulinase family protein [Oceanobacillus piezotolerans]